MTLDPRYAIDTHSENAIELVFDGLLRVNEKLEVVPGLAESYQAISPTEYVVKLRKGVLFHDGTPLTAEDVVDTFTFVSDEKNASPHRGTFRLLKSVTAKEGDTVRFVLTEPYSFFLSALRRPIVPKGASRARGTDFAKVPVGTGPFRLLKNLERDGVELGAYPKYFRGGPKVDRVRLKPILDTNVRLLELMKGSIDIIQNTADGFAPGSLEKLKSEPNLQVQTMPSTNVQYLNFNLHHPLLKQLKVRQAIAHAVDRASIVRYKLSGFATVATGLLTPAHWAYEPNVQTYSFDPKLSRDLLDQAGLKGKIKLVYKTSTNPQSIEIAQVIASQLEEVGIGVELRSLDFATLLDDVKKGNFDIYSMQWTSVLTPDHYYEVFHSKSVPPEGLNRNFYANPALDKLLEAGRKTVDPESQRKIYSDAQKLVAKDLPCLPLWYPQHIAVVRDPIEGYRAVPRGTYDSLVSVVRSATH